MPLITNQLAHHHFRHSFRPVFPVPPVENLTDRRSEERRVGKECRSRGARAVENNTRTSDGAGCQYFLDSFFFSSRRRHTRCLSDWSSDVCSSDLILGSKRFC